MTSPSESTHTIRMMTTTDFEAVLELIETEDWFLTRKKLDIMQHEKMASFFILEDAKTKQFLGYMNVIPTGIEAHLGNVIIQLGFRGQGLGSYFLKQVLKLYSGTIVSWFSESDAFYERLGAQASGEVGCYFDVTVDKEAVNNFCNKNIPDHCVTTNFTDDRFDDLIHYDIEARGYDNRPYVSVVTRTSDHTLLAVKESDKTIVGYASSWLDKTVIRFNGFYADDDKIAALLFREHLSKYPDVNVMKYVNMGNTFLSQFGTINGVEKMNRFAFGGKSAPIPGKKLYCLTDADVSH